MHEQTSRKYNLAFVTALSMQTSINLSICIDLNTDWNYMAESIAAGHGRGARLHYRLAAPEPLYPLALQRALPIDIPFIKFPRLLNKRKLNRFKKIYPHSINLTESFL